MRTAREQETPNVSSSDRVPNGISEAGKQHFASQPLRHRRSRWLCLFLVNLESWIAR